MIKQAEYKIGGNAGGCILEIATVTVPQCQHHREPELCSNLCVHIVNVNSP